MRADLEYFDTEMEGLFIEIDKHVFDTTSDLVIGIIYRMPNSSIYIFNDRLNDILYIIHRERKICYFLGDLNIDLLKYEEHRPTSEFLDLIYSYNGFHLISKPTRITSNTATLIDHILTNNFQYHSKHFQGILCSSISDHYAIFHLTDNCKSGLPEKMIKRVFNQANIQKFTERMKYIVWGDTLLEQDTQKAYSTFHDTLCQIYNRCFPVRKINKKYHFSKPWLTPALKQSIKIKNKLYVSRNKGKNTEEKNKYYKKYRNKLHNLIKSAERKYYQELLLKHKSNMKKAWNIIKMVINKREQCQISNRFKCNGKTIEDENLIANKFNDFFINIGPELDKNIPPSNKSPSEYITNVSEATFTINAVTDTEVANIIGNFNDSAAGWDDLRPKIIKGIKDYVKLPLTHLCNLSFVSGIFPTELRVANVVPIYKSNDEIIFSNYRPVSVLPVLFKLLERLMYNRLIHYINENRLQCKLQFGFQKGKSTEVALIVLMDHLSEALDKGEYVIGVFWTSQKPSTLLTIQFCIWN